MADIYLFRRKTAADWTAANPVLMSGELGLETDTTRFKFGDGTTAWNSLAYAGASVGIVPWGSITGTLSAQADLVAALGGKQATLVSATNIKTINGSTILGSGDLVISGSGAIWGAITGTLSAQTDLQTALNLKANTSSLAAVATSGSASDLGTGTLPTGRLPAFGSGDVSFAASGGAGTIAANAVDNTKLADVPARTLKGKATAGAGDPEDIAVGQDTVVGRLAGGGIIAAQLVTAQVADDAITNVKLADVATATIKGRVTAGTGDVEDLTGTQATTLLDVFTSGLKGVAPASGGGTSNFLRADGTWAAPGGGGSPGGSSGEIQYNNGGAFAGAADVEIEGGQLRLPAIATPTAPAASGVKLFGRNLGGRILPAIVGPSGLDSSLQPHIGRNKVSQFIPSGNGGATTQSGLVYASTGTLTTANVATTNLFNMMRRVEYLVTVASTTAVVGLRGASLIFTVGGGSAQLGGFHNIVRWGPATGVATSTHRMFMGLRGSVSAPTDVNPSTLTDIVGVGYDAADANFQFMHNDGSGTATKIDLGGSFAKPTADRTSIYDLALFSPPGTTQSVGYLLTDILSGATASGTVTTDLPSTTTLMAPWSQVSVGGTSSVIGIGVMSHYIETDY